MSGPAALCIVALCCVACEETRPAGPPVKRVVAVKARGGQRAPLEGFCDVVGKGRSARRLALPALDRPHRWPDDGARWVNVWATWCKPCVAEMPLLVSWKSRLARAGLRFSLTFVSADESAEVVARHRADNPRIPASLLLKSPDLLASWIEALGLDAGAGLPIHIFADAGGTIRCVRAAALGEEHYGLVTRLLGRP